MNDDDENPMERKKVRKPKTKSKSVIEDDDGLTPIPNEKQEDMLSESPLDGTNVKSKGTFLRVWLVWLFLTILVLGLIVGIAVPVVTRPQSETASIPPGLVVDPETPFSRAQPTLPNLPDLNLFPCTEDAACGYINNALDPVFPPNTKASINVPGTCQNWAREWLRSGKDIMEYQAARIRQRFTMAHIYCEFGGENWLESDLWVSELHECDWYTQIDIDPCSRNEEYQIIRLSGQQIRGTLPPELSMISSLWEIVLTDTLISGTIPTDYAKLEQLDTLQLSFNLLSGPVPSLVWEFEDMTFLDLGHNNFTGTLPDTVPLTGPNLKNLFLEKNDMTGSIPATFGSLNWQRLHLDRNRFTGMIPTDINSASLQELLLHNNMFTGEFPSSSFANDFIHKSELKEISLYGNNLTGDLNEMCQLATTGNLEVFEVDLNKVFCQCCSGPP